VGAQSPIRLEMKMCSISVDPMPSRMGLRLCASAARPAGGNVKQRDKIDIAPFWRAFFAYFFCYQCFSDIRAQAASLGLQQSLFAGPLAAGWIITNLLWKLPDPYWVVSAFAFVFILPVQRLANRVNARITPDHDPTPLHGLELGSSGGWGHIIMLMLIILGIIDTLLPGFIDSLLPEPN
jgi:hypothetical protein